jgi:hypothetical protein
MLTFARLTCVARLNPRVQFDRESSLSQNVGFSTKEPIAAHILRLGLKYAEGTIVGSDARCIAMLDAFKRFFEGDALKAKVWIALSPQ